MEIDYKGFAIRLDYLMQEKGINEQELAEHIGIHRTTINRWRNCKIQIDGIMVVQKLANEFDVNPDWLLYGFIRR